MNKNNMLHRLQTLDPIIQTLSHNNLVYGKDVCEIGTGRYPLFPVLFSKMGASSITTCDLNKYLVPELQTPAEQAVNEYLKTGYLNEPSQSLFEYLAPVDFRDAPFNDDVFDLLFSNAVFEHILPDIIDKIHQESFRVLKPGGYVFHNIDLTDHFSHSDPSISKLQFLKFSNRFWRFLVGGTFFYQNRIRASQHIKSLEAAGFVVSDVQKVYVEENSKYSVHKDINEQCSGDDFKVTHVTVLARKPANYSSNN